MGFFVCSLSMSFVVVFVNSEEKNTTSFSFFRLLEELIRKTEQIEEYRQLLHEKTVFLFDQNQ